VLLGLWLNHVFGIGPYRKLARQNPADAKRLEDVATDHAAVR
jgi:hypothetical protein